MSKDQTEKDKATEFLNVLYDTVSGTFLGRGGIWMSAVEFARNPPKTPRDLVPPTQGGEPPIEDPDPGPTPRCINGQLFVCSGNICTKVLRNGQPVPCP
jgi:hypothetical protein